MKLTRKNKRNNALKEAQNVERKAAYSLEHKHSKVANILKSPGKYKSVNAERIKKESDEKIESIAKKYSVDVDELRRDLQKEKIEPSKLVESAKELRETVEKEMKSNDGKVTITLTRGLASTLLFILNLVIFLTVTLLGVFQLLLTVLSAFSGSTSGASSLGDFWEWIFKGKWIVTMSSFQASNSNMKYLNNPMH